MQEPDGHYVEAFLDAAGLNPKEQTDDLLIADCPVCTERRLVIFLSGGNGHAAKVHCRDYCDHGEILGFFKKYGAEDGVFAAGTQEVPDLEVKKIEKEAAIEEVRRKIDLSDLAERMAEVPKPCFQGIFSEYRDAVGSSTEASDNYHFASLMTVLGLVIGRGAYVPYGQRIYPNFYTCLVGKTGRARKTTSISMATRLLSDLNGIAELGALGSYEGILKAMQRRRLVLLPGEYRSLAAKAKADSSNSIVPGLTHIFDCPRKLNRTLAEKEVEVENPFAAILTSSTPTWLQESSTDSDATGGFLNRWLFIDGEPKEPLPFPDPIDDDAWSDLRKQIRALHRRFESQVDELEFPFDDEAKEVWKDYYAEVSRARAHDPTVAALMERNPTHVVKVALLFAILDMPATTIRPEHLLPAIEFGRWLRWSVERSFHGWGITEQIRLEERILNFVAKNRGVTKRDVQRSVCGGKFSARDFKFCVDNLIQSEMISAARVNPRRTTLYLPEHLEEEQQRKRESNEKSRQKRRGAPRAH